MSKSADADRRYTRSSSFKMALFFTVLLGISVSILAYFLNEFNESSLIREVELGIDSNIAAFQDWQVLAFDLVDAQTVLDNMQKNHPGTWYVYYAPDGRVLYQDISAPDNQISTLAEGIILFEITPVDLLLNAQAIREKRTVAAKIHTFDDNSRLLVARDIEDALESRQLMRILGLITILLMLAVIAISFFVSTYVVRLINSIARTTREIMVTGDLSRRISVNTTWDDLGNLAQLLNDMLSRIEHLLQGVRRVADNIAHDLRTPLSRLRNHLESLNRQVEIDGDEDLQRKSSDLIAEADHLLHTFNALLRIANIESGKRHSEFALGSLTELVEDVVDFYVPLAEEKEVEIRVELDDAQMICDRDLLFQAVANVLDNAIKFSPQGTTIDVRLYRQAGHFSIAVADQGYGVPDDEKDKIFSRFYRAEHSRNSPGNGLGLSLVGAIVDLHGGIIELRDNNPGLIVSILLPCQR